MTNGTATANATAHAVVKGLRDAATIEANEAYKAFQQITKQEYPNYELSVDRENPIRKEAVAKWAYWEAQEEAYNKILADLEKRIANSPKI